MDEYTEEIQDLPKVSTPWTSPENDRELHEWSMTGKPIWIPLENLQPHNNNRSSFDQRKLDELAASIKAEGVVTPIHVRPMEDNPDHYEIVAGERRWRAAKIAGLAGIPALVREMDDQRSEVVQTLENLHREDLTPLEQADKFVSLLSNTYGGNVKDLAAATGYPQDYIYRYLHLTNLIPDAKSALVNKSWSLAVALEVARLPQESQPDVVAWWVQEWGNRAMGSVTHTDVRRFIAQNILLDLANATFSTTDPNLVPAAGACTDCPKRTGNDALLFPDIQNGDTCLDPICFQTKVKAHIAAQMEKRPELVQVSSYYSSQKSGVLAKNGYEQIKKKDDKCPSTEGAIVIEGSSDVGKLIRICRDRNCKKHGFHNSSPQPQGESADPAATRKATIEKNKADRLETKCRIAMLAACAKKYKSPSIIELRAIAFAVYKYVNLTMDPRALFIPMLGQEWTKDYVQGLAANMWDCDKAITSYLAARSSTTEIYRFIFLVTNFPHTQANDSFHTEKDILALTKEYGVDPKAIRKTVHDEQPVKQAKTETPAAGKRAPAPRNAAKRAAASK